MELDGHETKFWTNVGHHRAVTINTKRYEPYGLAVDRRAVEGLHTGELLADPAGEVWSGIPNGFEM